MKPCAIAVVVVPLFCGVLAGESFADGKPRVNSPLRATVADGASGLRPTIAFETGGQTHQAVRLQFDADAYQAVGSLDRVVIEEFALSASESVALDLHAIEVFTPDAQLVAAHIENGKVVHAPLPRPDVALLGGTVAGDASSQVFLSLSPHGSQGYVRTAGQMHVISTGTLDGEPATVIYDAAALEQHDPVDGEQVATFTCATDEVKENALIPPPAFEELSGIAGGTPPCRQIQVAVETDYEFLNNVFGGDQVTALAYVATIFGAVTQIYTDDVNTRVQVSFVRLWTNPTDPWTASNTSGQLVEFRNYWNDNMVNVPRSLAHMLSGRALGGGIAYLNAICHPSHGYAVSANLNGAFPFPLQSNDSANWDIMVVSHELGHNFGSPHTHSYSPPIDGCGNGDCTDANLGTIMSYCHQCPGGMSNIVIDLHPIVSQVILNYLDSLTECNLTGEGIPPIVGGDFYVSAQNVSTVLDVLGNDEATNCDAIELLNFDSTTTSGGSVALSEGTGPNGRDQLIHTPALGFTGLDRFGYSITDSEDLISGGLVNVTVIAVQAPAFPAQTQPGLKTEYYALPDPQALPDFNSLSPYLAETVSDVDFPSTGGAFAGSGLADNVGAVFAGYVSIEQAGVYTFFVESDDGSKLWIGNTLVVDNDGLHAMVEQSGSIALAPGLHKLRIEFFERGGGAGVIARYSANGITKQSIPAAVLFRNVPADVNDSGSVNVDDLLTVINAWGACPGPSAACEGDVTGNGVVDVDDLLAVINAWG